MFDSFPICRTIFNHWIYSNPEYLKIWITMLGKARCIKDTKKGLYQNVNYELNYGQFIFGRTQWSKDLNIGEQKIRTCIKKLINDEMIFLVKNTSKFSIYEIKNYEKFNRQDNQQQSYEKQGITENNNQQDNQQVTISQPSANHQITTNEESKERKKEKNNIYNEQAEKLWKLYPSQTGKGRVINKIPKLIKDIGYEQLVNAIDRYKKHVDTQRLGGFNLKYQNGSTFFNSGYVDYLDENFQENKTPKKVWGADN